MKGFSLLELMVVCGIIAILACLAMPSMAIQYGKSQVTHAMGDIARVRTDLVTSVTFCANNPPANLNTLVQYDYTPPPSGPWMCRAAAINSETGAPGTYVDGAAAGPYVSALSFNGTTMLAVFGGASSGNLKGATLSLTPTWGANGVSWICTFDATHTMYNPSRC